MKLPQFSSSHSILFLTLNSVFFLALATVFGMYFGLGAAEFEHKKMRLLLCIIALLSATTLFGQTHFNLLEAKSVTVVPGEENGSVTETCTFVMVCQIDDVKMIGFDLNKNSSLQLSKGDTLKVQITTQDDYMERDPTYYGSTKRPSTVGSVYVNGMPVSCSIPPGVLTDEVGGGRVVAIFHYDTATASFFFGVEDFIDKEFIALP